MGNVKIDRYGALFHKQYDELGITGRIGGDQSARRRMCG
jgi:hypothetical protein